MDLANLPGLETDDALYIKYFKEEADKILQGAHISKDSQSSKFVNSIYLEPYGVLGAYIPKEYAEEIQVGQKPGSSIVIVDPCFLNHIKSIGGPQMAQSMSCSIYEYIGLDTSNNFPNEIINNIIDIGDAKLHEYQNIAVIHCAQPDFTKLERTPHDRKKVIKQLSIAYTNIFHEFLLSGKNSLKLTPLCTGRISGVFKNDLPTLTYEAIMKSYESLNSSEQLLLFESNISLCIYLKTDILLYEQNGFVLHQNNKNNKEKEIQNEIINENQRKNTDSESEEEKVIRLKVKPGQTARQLAELLTIKYNLPNHHIHALEQKLRKTIKDHRLHNQLYGDVVDEEDSSDSGYEDKDEENIVNSKNEDTNNEYDDKKFMLKLRHVQNKHIELKLMLLEARESLSNAVTERIEKQLHRDDLLAQLYLYFPNQIQNDNSHSSSSWGLMDAIIQKDDIESEESTNIKGKNKNTKKSMIKIIQSDNQDEKSLSNHDIKFKSSFYYHNKGDRIHNLDSRSNSRSQSRSRRSHDTLASRQNVSSSDINHHYENSTLDIVENKVDDHDDNVKEDDGDNKIDDEEGVIWDEEVFAWLSDNNQIDNIRHRNHTHDKQDDNEFLNEFVCGMDNSAQVFLLDNISDDDHIKKITKLQQYQQKQKQDVFSTLSWSLNEKMTLPTPEQLSGFLIGFQVAPQPRYFMTSSSSSILSKTRTTPYLKTLAQSLKHKRIFNIPSSSSSSTTMNNNNNFINNKNQNLSNNEEEESLSSTRQKMKSLKEVESNKNQQGNKNGFFSKKSNKTSSGDGGTKSKGWIKGTKFW